MLNALKKIVLVTTSAFVFEQAAQAQVDYAALKSGKQTFRDIEKGINKKEENFVAARPVPDFHGVFKGQGDKTISVNYTEDSLLKVTIRRRFDQFTAGMVRKEDTYIDYNRSGVFGDEAKEMTGCIIEAQSRGAEIPNTPGQPTIPGPFEFSLRLNLDGYENGDKTTTLTTEDKRRYADETDPKRPSRHLTVSSADSIDVLKFINDLGTDIAKKAKKNVREAASTRFETWEALCEEKKIIAGPAQNIRVVPVAKQEVVKP